jgi:hypothetical protein
MNKKFLQMSKLQNYWSEYRARGVGAAISKFLSHGSVKLILLAVHLQNLLM